MNRTKALKKMLKGKMIRSINWPSEEYIFINQNGILMNQYWDPVDLNDSIGDYWELYKETESVLQPYQFYMLNRNYLEFTRDEYPSVESALEGIIHSIKEVKPFIEDK